MRARQKLNRSYFNGSVFIAGLVGWLAGSWLVFIAALAALLACNLCASEIRPSGNRGRSVKAKE
jgi:hypothetical protein